MTPERIWAGQELLGDIEFPMWREEAFHDHELYIRADVIKAFFEASEFQNIDELMRHLTLENAKKIGEVVAERSKRMVSEAVENTTGVILSNLKIDIQQEERGE